MPRFFFHLRTAQGVERDEVGTPFSDLEAAYLDACRAIPAMVPEFFDQGHDPLQCVFEITDERGQPLMEVPFAERLTRAAPPPSRSAEASPSTADLLARLDQLSRETQARAAELRRAIRKGHELMARATHADRPFLDRLAETYGIGSGARTGKTRQSGRSDP